MSRIQYLLATGLYVGYSPFAPGTAGSLLGLVICWFFLPVSLTTHVLMAVILFFVGVWASLPVESDHGEDPSMVVIDEIVGMLIALIATPVSLINFAAAFLAFRIFDVWKPYPANKAEQLPSGWGIMADDVVAGIYAFAIVQLLRLLRIL